SRLAASSYLTSSLSYSCASPPFLLFFSLPHPPTPALYTLSLHDALPICTVRYPSGLTGPAFRVSGVPLIWGFTAGVLSWLLDLGDRKSTRLNSSHVSISYAVFCLKKKKKNKQNKADI